MKNRVAPLSVTIRLLLALLILGQGWTAQIYGSAPVSLTIAPPYAAPPEPITDLNGLPDFDAPFESGKIKLAWTSPPITGSSDNAFSYEVRYATFSAESIGGNMDNWWNHPQTSMLTDSELPQNWGVKAYAVSNTTETIVLTGLTPGQYYYFSVRSYDRYHRLSDYDLPMQSITNQANTFASVPPWTVDRITDLVASDTPIRGTAYLEWTVPLFIDTNGFLVNGNINFPGEYCIQYSTSYQLTNGTPITNPSQIALPDGANNWDSSTRIYLSTHSIQTGDRQSYLLTDLFIDATYYIHLYTRTEWPDRWSQASVPETAEHPYVTLKPINNFLSNIGGSTDTAIGSYMDLSWNNPSDEPYLYGVRICYSTSTYPASPDWPTYIDLDNQIEGDTTGYRHVQLLPRTSYFYTAYTYDSYQFYSSVGMYTYLNTVIDLIPPDTINNLTGLITVDTVGTGYDYNIDLTWDTPPAIPDYINSDYAGVNIYYSTFTNNFTQQTLLTQIPGSNSESQAYQHNNLETYTTYYYSFEVYDVVNNTNTPVQTMLYISEDYIPPSIPTLVTSIADCDQDPNVGANIYLSWTSPPENNVAGVRVICRPDRYPVNFNDYDSNSRTYDWQGGNNQDFAYQFTQLTPNATYYIGLFGYTRTNVPSQGVYSSVQIIIPWLDSIAPFQALGMNMAPGVSNSIKLQWKPVKYHSSAVKFVDANAPRLDELYTYQVYRSTYINVDNWNLCTSLNSLTTYYDATLPSNDLYYFKIRAADVSGNYNDSNIISTDGELITLNYDDGSYILLTPELAGAVSKEQNIYNNDLVVRIQNNSSEEMGPVVKSVIWDAYQFVESTGSFSLNLIEDFSIPGALANTDESGEFAISYTIGTPQGTATAPSLRALRRGELETLLSVYYFNGVEWLRLGSTVDTEYRRVYTRIKFAGKYQLRRASPATDFTFYGIMPKIITPNNDGQNDRLLFRYANPRTSPITIKIFDIKGALVRSLNDISRSSDIQGEFIYWDAADESGETVLPGVYIYQLEGEGKVINGTVVVAR